MIYLEICSSAVSLFLTKGLLLLEHGPNCRLPPSRPLSPFAFETMLWHIRMSFLVLYLTVTGQSFLLVNDP